MDSHAAPGIAREQQDVDAVLEKARETTGLLSDRAPLSAYAQGVIDTHAWLTGATDTRPSV